MKSKSRNEYVRLPLQNKIPFGIQLILCVSLPFIGCWYSSIHNQINSNNILVYAITIISMIVFIRLFVLLVGYDICINESCITKRGFIVDTLISFDDVIEVSSGRIYLSCVSMHELQAFSQLIWRGIDTSMNIHMKNGKIISFPYGNDYLKTTLAPIIQNRCSVTNSKILFGLYINS